MGYIAASLRDAGCEVAVLDAEAEGYTLGEHCEKLRDASYDVLGISALINKYEYVAALAEASKTHHPRAEVVLGGGITGPIWELLLGKTRVDVLVIGEGEETIRAVLPRLGDEAALEEVDGVAFRRRGKPFQTPFREPVPNLDDLPFPAYDLFPTERYVTTPGKLSQAGFCKRDLSMLTSRGCPFSCTFCYRPPWEKVRYRSMESLEREIRHLKDAYAVDGITFNDELTLANRKRSYALCDTMERMEIVWGCVGRVNTVDAPLLKRMHEAGCRWMTYGIESGSQAILDEMKKKVRVETARNAVRWTQEAGISTNPTFILGYPSETRETAMESLRFILDLNLNTSSFFFATPYPGTELFREAVAAGRINASVDDYLRRISDRDAHELLVNLTAMSDEGLLGLRDEILEAAAAHRRSLREPLWKAGCRVLREEGLTAFMRKSLKKLGLGPPGPPDAGGG